MNRSSGLNIPLFWRAVFFRLSLSSIHDNLRGLPPCASKFPRSPWSRDKSCWDKELWREKYSVPWKKQECRQFNECRPPGKVSHRSSHSSHRWVREGLPAGGQSIHLFPTPWLARPLKHQQAGRGSWAARQNAHASPRTTGGQLMGRGKPDCSQSQP